MKVYTVLIHEKKMANHRKNAKALINRFVVLGADSIPEARALAERRFRPLTGWSVSNVVVAETVDGEHVTGEIVMKAKEAKEAA